MADIADLEISLHRHDTGAYAVEFRFSQPDSDADIRLGPGAVLRLKLLLGASAPELNRLRWENLRDPQNPEAPLCTSENLWFSRYLSSLDSRPMRRRPKSDLRALLVVANPANLAEYNLAPVDVPGETERARRMYGLPVAELITPAQSRVTCPTKP